MKLSHPVRTTPLPTDYEIRNGHVSIDGDPIPYLLAEDGPRIEPEADGLLTVLWLPIIINKPCPQLGTPESARPIQIEQIESPEGERWSIEPHEHTPVQHRDGKPPWCNACGFTANWTHHTQLDRLRKG